jgi:hypothetical protein
MYGHVETTREKIRAQEMFKEERYCGTNRTKHVARVKIDLRLGMSRPD